MEVFPLGYKKFQVEIRQNCTYQIEGDTIFDLCSSLVMLRPTHKRHCVVFFLPHVWHFCSCAVIHQLKHLPGFSTGTTTTTGQFPPSPDHGWIFPWPFCDDPYFSVHVLLLFWTVKWMNDYGSIVTLVVFPLLLSYGQNSWKKHVCLCKQPTLACLTYSLPFS